MLLSVNVGFLELEIPVVGNAGYPWVLGGLPSMTARATVLAEICNAITPQPIELGSCSNPLRIQQVFQFKLKKCFFRFGCGVFFGWRHNKGMFSPL